MGRAVKANGRLPDQDKVEMTTEQELDELSLIRRLQAKNAEAINTVVILFLVLVVTIGLVGFWLQLRP